MRGLAFSIKGQYDTAIRDYDAAIALKPDFAVALNNRAWAYFRWGKAAAGLPDVEKSLQLNPKSPHCVRHPRPHPPARSAILKARCSDYDRAMRYGGAPLIKLYQCGLQESRLLQRRDRRHLAAGADQGAAESACATRLANRCRPERSAHSCHNRGRLVR